MSEFTIVGRYPTLPLAQLALATLEAEGITGFFENAEVVNADWMLGNAVGDIKLLVATAETERAIAILEASNLRKIARQEIPDDAEVCLACGAEFPEEADTCPQCGWSFGDDAIDSGDLPENDASEGLSEYEPPATINSQDCAPTFLGGMKTWARMSLRIAAFMGVFYLIMIVAMLLTALVWGISRLF